MSNGFDALHDDEEEVNGTGTEGTGTEGTEGNEPTAEELAATAATEEAAAAAPAAREAAGGEATPEPTAEEIAAEEAATATAEGTEGAEGPEGSEVAPGIEQFLAQYNITGGMIKMPNPDGGDPTLTHYNDLDPETQFNVLSSLAANGGSGGTNLSEDEAKILSWAKDSGKTLSEAIEGLAQSRAGEILTLQNSSNEAYETMDSDAITTKWLKESNPEATEADVIEELERLKTSKFYDKNVEAIRGQFVEKRSADEAKETEARNAEVLQKLEEDRGVIANAAMETEYIAGWPVDDDTKNELLGELLEVNEHGDSKFVQEVFSDPKKLFEVAWLARKGPEMFDQMEKYYKKQLANKYQEGKNAALNGLSPNPINSGGAGKAPDAQAEQVEARQEGKRGWGSIHDED